MKREQYKHLTKNEGDITMMRCWAVCDMMPFDYTHTDT